MIFFYAPSFNTLFYFFRIIKYNNSILYLCKKIKNDVHSSSYKNIFKGGRAIMKIKFNVEISKKDGLDRKSVV